jgi:hypothetical protein
MALTDLIFGGPKKLEVGVIQFDCSVEEVHTQEAEATNHAVEDGSEITDHIRALPIGLQLQGIITDTPIVFLASLRATSPLTTDVLPAQNRVDIAFKKLEELKNNGELIDVVTTLKTYSNMFISSISVTRNSQSGNILNVGIGLKEIRIAKSLSIESPIPDDVANNAAAELAKKQKAAASAQQQQSVLSSLTSMFG